MYEKVVVPTDGSDLSLKGVKEGLETAKSHGIPALCIYVIKPSSLSESGGRYRFDEFGTEAIEVMREQRKKTGKKVLEKVKEMAEEEGVDLKTKLVEGLPYEEITSHAGENDIIYMCSHGRSGISSIFLGSTTDRVIKHTKSTVAVVKANNDKEE